MKIFICNYYWSGNFGAYSEINLIIAAETKEVALGLALEYEYYSRKENWSIEEFNKNDIRMVHEISRSGT